MAERKRRGLAGLPFGLSSAAKLRPSLEEIQATIEANRPEPMTTIIASAGRLTSTNLQDSAFRRNAASDLQWQQDAWSMYDLVGELRFLVDTMATRTSKAKLYVGRIEDPEDDPIPVDDEKIQGILRSIGDGPTGLSRLIERLVANLKVTGDGWLAGIPEALIPEEENDADLQSKLPGRENLPRGEAKKEKSGESLADFRWFMLSVSEIAFHADGKVTIQLGPAERDKLKVPVDEVHLVRVWKPHPQFSWQADSSTRAGLPVLRELVGLTMHISAQIDSRLAGAGVFIVPASAARAVKRAMGMPEDSADDPFTDALMMSMLTPITDRSSASAVVPLVLTVPDEAADKFRHIDFQKTLDSEARAMRDEAIRRFALGADAPPELLMGNADMNHWNGWLTREDVVSNHIEPVLGLICDALTGQFLRPVLEENSIEGVEKYVIWYDVQHLIVRNNRGGDAMQLYDRGAVSAEALRYANGFDEDDAPGEDDPQKQASRIALEMFQQNPGLMRNPGLEPLVEQIKALLEGRPLPKAQAPAAKPSVPAGTSSSGPAALPGGGKPAPTAPGAPMEGGMRILDPSEFDLRGSLSALVLEDSDA